MIIISLLVGGGYPQTIIYNPKLIFKMSEASTRVPSCRKSTSNTKTSTPHTQNHDLETEYDTQLPSRKLDDISLKIDGWKTTFQLGFDCFHFGKLYSFKNVCFWNALQTCLAFFKVTKVAGLLEFSPPEPDFEDSPKSHHHDAP